VFLGHRLVPLQFRKSSWPKDQTEALEEHFADPGASGHTSRAFYVICRLPVFVLPARPLDFIYSAT
jgi:hypothetical protein